MGFRRRTKTVRFLTSIDLQAERAKAGLTQRQLADKAGCHIQTVRYWESRKNNNRDEFGGMYSKTVQRMADAMELEPIMVAHACSSDGRMNLEMAEALGLGFLYCKPVQPKRYCGAHKPDGRKCRKLPVAGRTRCRQHGGLSTGPKTPAGKMVIAAAQRKRHAATNKQSKYAALGSKGNKPIA